MADVFEFALPAGALVVIGQHQVIHLGGGRFQSDEPVWIFEGVTANGSEAAQAWTREPNVLLQRCPKVELPSERRVGVGQIATAVPAPA